MGENKLTVMVYSVLGLRALAVQDLATPLYTTYNVIKKKKAMNVEKATSNLKWSQ